VRSPESETSVPDVFNFRVIAHSDVAIDAHRECLLLADFVAKLFATLPIRNYRIQETGISNRILRALAHL